MHKIVCPFCGKAREEIDPKEFFFEAPDKKTYICSLCIDKAHRLITDRMLQNGFKLQLVKDSL